MKTPTLHRRDFNLGLAAVAGAAALPGLALAQAGQPVEGSHYLRLPQALASSGGKIEVLEFFLYTCPVCLAFDPQVTAWSKQLPADVSFRRVHVGVGAMHKLHQRLMFALETLGQLENLHGAVFKALHVDRVDLSSEKAITAQAVRWGLDEGKFSAAFNSFSAQARLAQSAKLAADYKADGVPALGIGGRFMTSPAMAGASAPTPQARGQMTLAVTDHLIRLVRGKA